MTKPHGSFTAHSRDDPSAEPAVESAKLLDAKLRAAIEKSLADPRPDVPAKDVHDRLARRHEARLKRGP